jgi:hypothetical protein
MMLPKPSRRLWTVVAIAAVAGPAIYFGTSLRSAPSPPAAAIRPTGHALPPPAQLRIHAADVPGTGDHFLNPQDDAWKQVSPTATILNRTPRLYQTEPVPDRPIPDCEVRAVRSGHRLWLRLQWDDATRNAPEAPPVRQGEGGDPKLLYKRPTAETASFADAAAVMVPDNWTGPAFPSLLMGDQHSPATLYYWSASRGGRVMTAAGRATPQPSGASFPFQARHADRTWTVTMALPQPPDGYPIAFAVWDGAFADRDGLKCFSVWHVLTRP